MQEGHYAPPIRNSSLCRGFLGLCRAFPHRHNLAAPVSSDAGAVFFGKKNYRLFRRDLASTSILVLAELGHSRTKGRTV
jgi:hypothetical protein